MSSLDLYQESRLQAIEIEIENQDFLMKCAEDWGQSFGKDEDTHIRIMRAEARLERKIRKVFRDISYDAGKYVNWKNYKAELKAAVEVDVVVDESLYDDINQSFINITYDTFLLATTIGAQAGEAIYDIPLGIDSTDAIMIDLTTKHVTSLLGKTVDKLTGKIVDNPRAKYRITDQTRKDVLSSIKTSISLGEDQKAATKRLAGTIDSPKRAAMIARTETVNSYSQGLLEFGRQSKATGKEWESVGATDVCAEYSAQGVIPFANNWGGLAGPAAHPNCRCSIRLAYPPEYEGK